MTRRGALWGAVLAAWVGAALLAPPTTASGTPEVDAKPTPQLIDVAAFFEANRDVCAEGLAAAGLEPHPAGMFSVPGLGFTRSPGRVVGHRAMLARDEDGIRRTMFCHHDFLRGLFRVTGSEAPPLAGFAETPLPEDAQAPVLFEASALAAWAVETCRAALDAAGRRETLWARPEARWDDPGEIFVPFRLREGLFGRGTAECRVDPLTGTVEWSPALTQP